MKTIWKFPLRLAGVQTINMPDCAKVRHVAVQHILGPQLWAEVDPTAKTEPRNFAIHGTGQPIADNEQYVGTFHQGEFVWHVYEVK